MVHDAHMRAQTHGSAAMYGRMEGRTNCTGGGDGARYIKDMERMSAKELWPTCIVVAYLVMAYIVMA